MKKNGYTLVEIMVVVVSLGMIMTATVGVILGSFRAQNRTKSNNKVIENGSWIINELRKNVFNSLSSDIVCGVGGSSVAVKNFNDGRVTTLSCNVASNRIASSSAVGGTVSLNNSEVVITDCTSFVVCETNADDEVMEVNFNFGIGATTSGIGITQIFTTKVTLRN